MTKLQWGLLFGGIIIAAPTIVASFVASRAILRAAEATGETPAALLERAVRTAPRKARLYI